MPRKKGRGRGQAQAQDGAGAPGQPPAVGRGRGPTAGQVGGASAEPPGAQQQQGPPPQAPVAVPTAPLQTQAAPPQVRRPPPGFQGPRPSTPQVWGPRPGAPQALGPQPVLPFASPTQGPVAAPRAWGPPPGAQGPGSVAPIVSPTQAPQPATASPPDVQPVAVAPSVQPTTSAQVQGPRLVGQGAPGTELLTQALSVVSLSERRNWAMPGRPGYGTQCVRKIRLVANHYPLNIPSGYIYHYDVEIESLPAKIKPEDLKKTLLKKATPQQVSGKRLNAKISREVMTRLFQQDPVFSGVLPAYDGNKSFFTRHAIQVGAEMTKLVSFQEEGRDLKSHFKVTVKPVSKADTNSNAINLDCLHMLFKGRGVFNDDCYQAIMAIEIVMRNGPALKLTSVGRSFFLPPRSQQDVHPLSEGKQIWFGHYQTIRPAQNRPMLVLDKSATTFYPPGPLVNYSCEFLNKNGPSDLVRLYDSEITRLSNDLRNAQICVNHLPYRRKYRVVAITKKSAIDLKFPETLKNGQTVQTSVADYFKKTYKPLKYPNLPCVQVNPKEKKIYQPMEVCELVEGQHYKRKLTDEQTSEMIKFTCTTPYDRFNDIQKACNQTLEDSRRYMAEFGLKVDNKPLHLEGRVLQAPKVMYGNEKLIEPRDGSWDLRETKFFRGAQIEPWAIVCLASDRFCTRQDLTKFAQMVKSMGVKMGMQIRDPAVIDYLGNRGLPMLLKDMLQKLKPQLVMIVLRDKSSYAMIKRVAEVELGLRTSCIQSSNVKKCNPQLVCNVLQKVNAKFDGQNSRLQATEIVPILEEPVLIIGVDVSHSAPGDKVKPSIAAAVGSLDKVLHNYTACIKAQSSRNENKQHIEVITEFSEMVVKLLKAFYRNTRQKPGKIIVYRDGVSEGEFATVCDFEIPKIDDACLQLQKDGGYQPQVTFIVVQKRHHTRFTPENYRDGVGKAKNVPPGTTVDKEIIHPVFHDFYLCSHFGIQGTSRPAHYTVLRDDNKLSADELQKLSYHLCHTYVRCTRSISIPAPVMYAHLAALRARHHLASLATGDDSSSDTFSEEVEREIMKQAQQHIEVEQKLTNTMYYI